MRRWSGEIRRLKPTLSPAIFFAILAGELVLKHFGFNTVQRLVILGFAGVLGSWVAAAMRLHDMLRPRR